MLSYSIGRANADILLIEDETVSRLHARLLIGNDGKFAIEHLSRTNETCVTTRKRAVTLEREGERAYITASSQVALGNYRCTVKDLIRRLVENRPGEGRAIAELLPRLASELGLAGNGPEKRPPPRPASPGGRRKPMRDPETGRPIR